MLALYEIKYSEVIARQLDDNFLLFDSSDVNDPKYREITAFKKFSDYFEAHLVGHFGLFSPRFTEKTGVSGSDVVRFVNENPNYDVYIFHPFPREVSIAYEFLDLAELEHPGISVAINDFWQDTYGCARPEVLCQIDYNLIGHCNYFVASHKFWQGYSKFVKKFVSYLFSDKGRTLRLHTKYTLTSSNEDSLPLAVFAFERCFTLYLKMHESKARVVNYAYITDDWEPVECFSGEGVFCQELRQKLNAINSHDVISGLAFNESIAAYYHYRRLSLVNKNE